MYSFENMNNQDLTSAYENAIQLNLSDDLIKVLYVEMIKRGIDVQLHLSAT
ncbi:sporulation histidine kinase inhibitor Sda [Falsibacillus albus]|nr:sporulation histidine kinase inhibitor Sda [Falsibacillus albus]